MRAHGDDIWTMPEVGEDCNDDEPDDKEESDEELTIEVGVTATSSSSIPANNGYVLNWSSIQKEATN